MRHLVCCLGVVLAGLCWQPLPTASSAEPAAAAKPPMVGEMAEPFTLPAVEGGTVSLKELTASGPVVLVVLRGYPGYQCPICTRQVGDFVAHAGQFQKADAALVFVYPGPATALGSRAQEFLGEKPLPEPARLLLDPGYTFTNAYHLRWDAPRETAYPSTFVIDRDGKIRFAKISKTHGGRTAADDVLKAVQGL